MKKPLIILTGPTAVGKTKASIGLAKALNGEIISADSMQVYKHMDIGSAKIRPEEMQGIKHYLIDELEPDEEFHVVRFQEMAKKALEEIYAKNKIPIVVGGTGFYIQALLYDIELAKKLDWFWKELFAYTKENKRNSDYFFELLEYVILNDLSRYEIKEVIKKHKFEYIYEEYCKYKNEQLKDYFNEIKNKYKEYDISITLDIDVSD